MKRKSLSEKGFTLVEIMIVVAILGLLVAIGVPGFLIARNKSYSRTELANLKAINDNIASYAVSEGRVVDIIERLWPTNSTISDPNSYIRRQLFCPVSKVPYALTVSGELASCSVHGTEDNINPQF